MESSSNQELVANSIIAGGVNTVKTLTF